MHRRICIFALQTRAKTHLRIYLIIITVRYRQKRSHIFSPEEPNLIAIRTKSYCPKIWFFRRQDMAAFFVGAKCNDVK